MKICLYLDEDAMDDNLLTALRAQGIDVTTVNTDRKHALTDEEQLVYATEQRRVIYTFNRKHFMVLHTRFLQENRAHGGIILAPERHRYSVGEQLRRLLAIVDSVSAEEIKDQALFLSNWN